MNTNVVNMEVAGPPVPVEPLRSVESLAGTPVVSGPGGECEISAEQRPYVCLLADGKMLVAPIWMGTSQARSLHALFRRQRGDITIVPAELEVIKACYDGMTSPGRAKAASMDRDGKQKMAFDIFKKAVDMRASDIHIRVSMRSGTKTLFRIQGVLTDVSVDTFDAGDALCHVIYQAMADVSDTTFSPQDRQDARIGQRNKLPRGVDGIRIATTPMTDGYLMVLRLLYEETAGGSTVQSLGYTDWHATAVRLMSSRPYGINILAGPTGSGKSTTLKLVLTNKIADAQAARAGIHVITVEDPPEYPIPGAVQTPVTNADGEADRAAAFSAAITASMRLDPDVMMISEIRDAASASAAFRAAMTGHQVWTTLHANSALAIVDRLVDLGVDMALVTDASLVTGLTCQRLVRLLCPHCSIPFLQNADRLDHKLVERVTAAVKRIESVRIKGNGCEHCNQLGTTGRTVVAEVVIPDAELMAHVRAGDRIEARNYWLHGQRGSTMLDHAVQLVADGRVDPSIAEEAVGPLTLHMLLEDSRLDVREVQSVV